MFQTTIKAIFFGLVAAAVLAGSAMAEGPYVFLVSIDGLRNEEAFETTPPFAYMSTIQGWYDQGEAAFYEEFYNDSRATFTTPGHETMLTGQWHLVPNLKTAGKFYDSRPEVPTIFECLRKQMPSEECYAVVGKTMCKQLDWSLHPSYGPQFLTELHCFPELTPWPWFPWLGSDDDVCDQLETDIETKVQQGRTIPKFVFVHLGDVDTAGHSNRYNYPGAPVDSYIEYIDWADFLVGYIWNEIINKQGWPFKDNTVLIVTSDHGRNYFLDSPDAGWGFKEHGGMSHQNRHVLFVARGPGIRNGFYSQKRFHIDLVPTVAALLGLDPTPAGADTKYARGQVMEEMFVTPPSNPRIYRHQKNPRIAAFAGNVAYVWSENDPALMDTGNEAVFAMFKRAGESWSGPIRVSPSFDGTSDLTQPRWAYYPDVAANNDGCHIVWLDSLGVRGPTEPEKGDPVPPLRPCWSIFYRGSSNWQTLKAEKLIALSQWETEGDPNELVILGDPELVCSNDGELIVTARYEMIPGDRFLKCFRSPNGFDSWVSKKITDPNVYHACVDPREYMGTILAEEDHVGVVWQDFQLKPNSTENLSWDIFFTKTEDNAESWAPPESIYNDNDYSYTPKVAYGGSDPRTVIVWSSRDENGLYSEIKTATNDGSGWTTPPVSLVQDAWAADLICTSRSGVFYLIWEDYSAGGDPELKYRTSSDGIAWTAPQTVMTVSGAQCNPQLAYDTVTTEVWAVWEEYQPNNGNWLINRTTIQ